MTGGDGVHFSLLASNASAPLDWPVVMTVPMALDCPNHIVGANLLDFLAIGLRSGYFILEQLPYDPDWALAAMLDPEEHFERPALMTQTLLAIRDHFALAAWDKHRQRLEELKSTFGLN